MSGVAEKARWCRRLLSVERGPEMPSSAKDLSAYGLQRSPRPKIRPTGIIHDVVRMPDHTVRTQLWPAPIGARARLAVVGGTGLRSGRIAHTVCGRYRHIRSGQWV